MSASSRLVAGVLFAALPLYAAQSQSTQEIRPATMPAPRPSLISKSTSDVRPRPISNDEFASRRTALANALTDGVILALGGREPSLDYQAFFQTPNFLYLTGVRETDAVLVGVKRGSDVTWTLFVEPKEPSREVWTGPRVGADGAEARWGLRGRSKHALGATLDSLLAAHNTLHVIAERGQPGQLSGDDQLLATLTAKRPTLTVNRAESAVLRLRAFKTPAELALIKRATAITVDAHRDAARAIRPDGFEYEVQADLERVFRRNGAERPSFSTIVGSGPNSTTLHYNANNRQMKAGEMVVVDIGALYEGYSADMTRSYPVTGTFTAAQKAVYQVVRDAQAAAERQAKPGNRAQQMSDSANVALAAGLARIGLVEAPDATYDCSEDGTRKCRQLSLFYMHGLGHGIGLEVHDPDRYSYDTRTMTPGSVFTIEPGVYVRENVLDILPKTPRNAAIIEKLRAAVERYRNIGVRIEDDYIITENGAEWITRSPREIAEIEAMMRRTRM